MYDRRCQGAGDRAEVLFRAAAGGDAGAARVVYAVCDASPAEAGGLSGIPVLDSGPGLRHTGPGLLPGDGGVQLFRSIFAFL